MNHMEHLPPTSHEVGIEAWFFGVGVVGVIGGFVEPGLMLGGIIFLVIGVIVKACHS